MRFTSVPDIRRLGKRHHPALSGRPYKKATWELAQPAITRVCRLLRLGGLKKVYAGNTFATRSFSIRCNRWMKWLQCLKLGSACPFVLEMEIRFPSNAPITLQDLEHSPWPESGITWYVKGTTGMGSRAPVGEQALGMPVSLWVEDQKVVFFRDRGSDELPFWSGPRERKESRKLDQGRERQRSASSIWRQGVVDTEKVLIEVVLT